FANGDPEEGVMVSRALAVRDSALLIAADGGLRVANQYGVQPQIIIGDMDSVDAEALRTHEESGVEILRYPAEKDETDLELALLLAVERGAGWVRILGAYGGRFDQVLANVYLLALPQLENVDVALVAGSQIIRLLRPGETHLQGQPGDTLSLVPISSDVAGITTTNLKYPLRNETLHFGPARGISNVMLAEDVTVRIQQGLLVCVHTEGRA
ncbi:MAG: thiamine diphosphokinase, partial [Anaerolineae bacterium]|nr:thiamine diphosphokinase [Anaerolineae bacterium]